MFSKWGDISNYLGFSGSQTKYTIGDYTSNSWYKGYNGYQEALQVSNENEVPVFIYVYADWCNYCKKFNNELLTNSRIKTSLSKFVKVKFNPEKSDQAKELYAKWNGRGYPAILFQSGSSNKPQRVRAPYTKNGVAWKLMSPDDFIYILEKNG